jgi:hypothetical protein
MKIEKLSDFKRMAKEFTKGAIKSKLFDTEKTKLDIVIDKNLENNINLCIENKTTEVILTVNTEVTTRVFNKVDKEMFEKTVEHLNKLKNFAGITVTMAD